MIYLNIFYKISYIGAPPPPKEPTPEPEPPKPVNVAPKFLELLIDSHETEGKPVFLKATVLGEPKPTIAWFKDGIPLLPDDQLQVCN